MREGGAVTGWGALRLAGAAYVDGLEPDGRTLVLCLSPSAVAESCASAYAESHSTWRRCRQVRWAVDLADLFDDEAVVVGECDGAEHRAAKRHGF